MSVLAGGSFGTVVRVQHRLLGKEYAIKRSAKAITEEGIRRAWCQVRAGSCMKLFPGNATKYGDRRKAFMSSLLVPVPSLCLAQPRAV